MMLIINHLDGAKINFRKGADYCCRKHLRHLLKLACEWRVIDRAPKVTLLPGERIREYVLNHEEEDRYLRATPQPLHDVAMLMLDTGLRVGEALCLQWKDVHFEPLKGAKFGFVHVKDGKSRNAKRSISLTARVRNMLGERSRDSQSEWVFAKPEERPMLVSSLDHLHARIRETLKLNPEFVIHSLRHTMLTRLGESGADAFTIMKIAGHSSVLMSQRYVHPTPEAMEKAMERLDSMNQKALSGVQDSLQRQLPATISATSNV